MSLNQECDCNFCRTGERDGYGHDDAPRAILVLGGWHGIAEYPVVIVGETPKKWRIEALEYTRLAGRSRALHRGQQALVPKHAVRFGA